MNIRILKRISNIEQKVRQSEAPPALIMIHYDNRLMKWSVTAHYTSGKWGSSNDYRAETSFFDMLQDFFFPVEFKGRVILDTFGSPDPTIFGNLFCFDMDDLREGQPGEIAIKSISEPKGERSITVSMDTCLKGK